MGAAAYPLEAAHVRWRLSFEWLGRPESGPADGNPAAARSPDRDRRSTSGSLVARPGFLLPHRPHVGRSRPRGRGRGHQPRGERPDAGRNLGEPGHRAAADGQHEPARRRRGRLGPHPVRLRGALLDLLPGHAGAANSVAAGRRRRDGSQSDTLAVVTSMAGARERAADRPHGLSRGVHPDDGRRATLGLRRRRTDRHDPVEQHVRDGQPRRRRRCPAVGGVEARLLRGHHDASRQARPARQAGRLAGGRAGTGRVLLGRGPVRWSRRAGRAGPLRVEATDPAIHTDHRRRRPPRCRRRFRRREACRKPETRAPCRPDAPSRMPGCRHPRPGPRPAPCRPRLRAGASRGPAGRAGREIPTGGSRTKRARPVLIASRMERSFRWGSESLTWPGERVRT